MVRATYTLHIDADRSEVFDADEAVTSDVVGSPLIEVTRGKEQLTQLSPPRAGDLACVLDNGPQGGNGTYSPSGSFGLAAGQLARFRATDPTTGTVHDLARAVIQRPRQVPGFPAQTTVLTGYGTLSRLAGKRVSTALYQNITTDTALGHLLDAAGWPKNFPAHSLDLTPAGYWGLGEASGAAVDSSGNGNNGTVTLGAGSRDAAALDDAGDGSIDFDGLATVISVTDAAALQNLFDGGGTVVALIRPDNAGEGNAGRIVEKGWRFHLDDPLGGASRLRFRMPFSGTAGEWRTTARDITDATAYLVAVIYNADAVGNAPALYIFDLAARTLVIRTVGSGLDVVTTPVGTRTTDVGTDLRIGNDSGAASTFDGRLDEVGAYASALTQAQATVLGPRAADAPRHLGVGQTTLEWFWLDEADAFEAALKLQSTEGPGSDLYEDGTGAVVFRDRHARLTEARSTAVQTAFTAAAAAAEPKLSALNYDEGLRNVINEAVLRVVRRTAGSDPEVFQWQSQQPYLSIAPGATASTSARLDDDGPGKDLVTGLLTGAPSATTLAAALNSTDLSSLVATGTAPTVGTNTIIDIEGEYLVVSSRVTGSPNDTLNFSGGRGRYGTTAAAHSSGVAVRKRAFIANAASGFDGANVTDDVSVSLDRTSGAAVRFTFVNNGSVPAHIFARLYGVQVTVQETYQVANTVDAATSIAEHGRRSYTLPVYEEIDVDVAQDFANAVVGWYQSGRPTVEIAVRGDAHATRMTACLAREVGDRVSIAEPETGVNDHFWVERITHRVEPPAQHLWTAGCEVASSGFGVAAIVGTTQVGSATERAWY